MLDMTEVDVDDVGEDMDNVFEFDEVDVDDVDDVGDVFK
jgi:hypothetical protein